MKLVARGEAWPYTAAKRAAASAMTFILAVVIGFGWALKVGREGR